MSPRARSTWESSAARRDGSRSATRVTSPGQLAYQSIALPSSWSCGSASMSAAWSPSRRRTTRRSWPAALCSGSPRTPSGRTPVRVVTIRVLSPAILAPRLAGRIWRRRGFQPRSRAFARDLAWFRSLASARDDGQGPSDRLGPLPEHEFLHLAGRGHRQVAEHHEARAFVAREVGAAVRHDLLGRGGRAWLQHHEGARRLAPFLVGLGDHRDIG